MVNKELLQETLAWIKTKPADYNQGNWVQKAEESPCGTQMCFAGHAAVLAGAENPDPKKHFIGDWYVKNDESKSYLNWLDIQKESRSNYTHVQEFATNALGLTAADASYLFGADRTVEEIEVAVEELLEYGNIQTFGYSDEDRYYCCEDCDGY